ncbi:MAG: hypothetical protein ABFC89_06440 [Methanospirillum sp.]
MPHPVNACADCKYVCDKGDPCWRYLGPDEDRAYDADQDRRICEGDA